MRISYILLLLLMLNLSCTEKSATVNQAGLAISFDDHFINEWYALRPLFQKYDAKVTFFVVCGDTLTADEVSKLKQLESDGHEIGFHGTVHGRSTAIIEASGPEKYAEEELVPGMALMKVAGFNPTSYAHPGGNHNDQVDSVLFSHGFIILRDVAIANRVYKGVPLYSLAPRVMSPIFYRFDKEKKVDGLLIDNDSGLDEDDLKEAVQKARDTNTALMLFGHKPLTGTPKPGDYGFDVAFLEKILKTARDNQMKYYTMSELPKL